MVIKTIPSHHGKLMNQVLAKNQLSVSLQQLATPLFICGGAHSGKSELGHQCLDPAQPAAIIGTCSLTSDLGLEKRIGELQANRPSIWKTYDQVSDLSSALEELSKQYPQVMVDSLNLYIATSLVNRLDVYDHSQIEDQIELEMRQLSNFAASMQNNRIVIISNDASAGMPPVRAPARAFRRMLSRANCLIADSAKSVIDVRYGVPVLIK